MVINNTNQLEWYEKFRNFVQIVQNLDNTDPQYYQDLVLNFAKL